MAYGSSPHQRASDASTEIEHQKPADTVLQIPSHSTYRNLAISAGDLRAGVLSEVARVLKQSGGNPLEALRHGLVRLHAQGLIKVSEVEVLEKVCEAVYAVQTGKRNEDGAFSEIRSIYQTLVAQMDTSPFALVLAGIAAGARPVLAATEQSDTAVAPAASRSNTIDAGILGGIIAGGIVGGAIGGFGGAIIGGIVGGIAGGVGTACAT